MPRFRGLALLDDTSHGSVRQCYSGLMSQVDQLCPVCNVKLFLGRAEDVAMLGCGRCGGQWLDNAGTQRVVQGLISEQAKAMANQVSSHSGKASPVKGSAYRASGAEKTARCCPICSQPLTAKVVNEVNIEIDVCTRHGTWFDPQELEQLARFFEFKNAVSDAEAAIETEELNRANREQLRARWGRNILGGSLGGLFR